MFLAIGCRTCSSSFTARASSTGWSTHRDPAGFSVELPVGWNVTRNSDTGRIDLRGPANQQVVIWPAWAPQGLNLGTARASLAQFVRRIGPDVALASGWNGPEPMTDTALRVVGRSRGRVGVAMLCWVPSAKGAAALFYAIAAPEDIFGEQQEGFGHILQSVRLSGTPSAATRGAERDPDVRYVPWTDPNEGAFSLQVPAGWKVEGGLIRRNALDPRAVVRITSPDGSIILSSGDAQLPGFVLPNPQWIQVFPEGSWYSPGAGIQWQVRRFTPAVPFGQEWLRLRLQALCSNLLMKDTRDRPDFARVMDQEAAGFRQFGHVTNSAGEIAFVCTQGGESKQGYLLVSTQLIQSGVLNLWYAKDLLGYLAPPSRNAEAQAILAHVASSTQINPEWIARQQQTTMQVSQIAATTQQHISASIRNSYWNMVNVHEDSSRKQENAMLGTTDVIDPATGEQRKIYNSGNYHWIDNRGRIVGTQTDSTPGLDFRRLIALP